MDAAIRITPITIDDLEKILDLGARLSDDENKYEPGLTFSREESYAHYLAELSNEDALIIAAKLEDGTITGYHYGYIHILEYLESNNKECVFEALYVDARYRGKGIAKALSNYAEHWAVTEKQANRISTHIYADNNASLQLHTSNGFKAYNVELVKNI